MDEIQRHPPRLQKPTQLEFKTDVGEDERRNAKCRVPYQKTPKNWLMKCSEEGIVANPRVNVPWGGGGMMKAIGDPPGLHKARLIKFISESPKKCARERKMQKHCNTLERNKTRGTTSRG